jgi:hypothetical protein
MLRYPTIHSFAVYLQQGEFDTIIQRQEEKKQGKNRMNKIRTRRKEAEANVNVP